VLARMSGGPLGIALLAAAAVGVPIALAAAPAPPQAAATVAPAAPSVQTRTSLRTLRLTPADVRHLGDAAFSGFVMYINNHDPIARPERESYYRADLSYVRFSNGGPQVPFELPELRVDYGFGPAYFYLNEVKSSQRPTLDLLGAELQFSIPLRGNGSEDEMIGIMRRAITHPGYVSITGMRLDAYLQLGRDPLGRMTYTHTHAVFRGAMRGTFVDSKLVTSPQFKMRAAVEDALVAFFDRAETRETVTRMLAERLSDMGVGFVTDVQPTGGNLVLVYRSRT
jgi:hypothetical protein